MNEENEVYANEVNHGFLPVFDEEDLYDIDDLSDMPFDVHHFDDF
ncbi:MAG: hypothetical protein QXN55_00400 [Candidatus Nitrosotenuis sp.]